MVNVETSTLELKKPPQTNEELIEYLRLYIPQFRNDLGAELDVSRLENIFNAMKHIDRGKFLPASARKEAYFNCPASIHHEQTCSQPSVVAFMAYLLELKEGDKVLEIGTGSGYSAALTALLIGKKGKLTSLERIPTLAKFGKKNLQRQFGSLEQRVSLILGNGSVGYPPHAPYDKIYFTAAAPSGYTTGPLLGQLNEGGILLLPQTRIEHHTHNRSSFEEYMIKTYPEWSAQKIAPHQPKDIDIPFCGLILYRKTLPWEEKYFAGFNFVPLVTDK